MLISRKYRASYHKNKGKSSLIPLVACFILGKVYCKAELNEEDMPEVKKNTPKVN